MFTHSIHLIGYSSGETALSASGILWPSLANHMDGVNGRSSMPGSAIVVTVASIVEPFLSRQYRENISLVKRNLLFDIENTFVIFIVNYCTEIKGKYSCEFF